MHKELLSILRDICKGRIAWSEILSFTYWLLFEQEKGKEEEHDTPWKAKREHRTRTHNHA